MKVVCVKNVVVSGRTVYEEGEVYIFEKIKLDGKTISYEGFGNFGKGVWMKNDPTFKDFFMKKKQFDSLQEKYNVNSETEEINHYDSDLHYEI